MQLLQSGQSILTVFQANLQKRALDNMTKSGIEVRTGVRVVAVESRSLTLESGEVVPFGQLFFTLSMYLQTNIIAYHEVDVLPFTEMNPLFTHYRLLPHCHCNLTINTTNENNLLKNDPAEPRTVPPPHHTHSTR